ncbi:hypothetical protein VUJ46_17720 [Chryseobacterium sp. MYb264]|uniref:hypothetical protein n=1 Tax=Chryseobacterium sp. MYb264 TaxID=2745153 RepID=UPI002E121853|nr:hypothetical protein VUJ46_17720 [Chryseobacterium sp. MYb264]
MKKLLIIGTLILSAVSFAKTAEKASVKEEKVSESKLFRPGGLYGVTFGLPCGGTVTVHYITNFVENTAGFNQDLAWIVNNAVEENCGAGNSGV